MNPTQDGKRLGPLEARQPVTVLVDGEPLPAFAGESVATVLLAHGRRTFRHTGQGAPRSLFCGMGICFDCLVTVDGVENVRACMTPVAEGMVIATVGCGGTEGRAETAGRTSTEGGTHG
jgi:aerobic-type carbon monoxide dehydrogenase small subunit (CoxS/CutS family)